MPVIRAQLTNLILKMVGDCANQETAQFCNMYVIIAKLIK